VSSWPGVIAELVEQLPAQSEVGSSWGDEGSYQISFGDPAPRQSPDVQGELVKPNAVSGSSRSQFGQVIDVCITESEFSSHRPVLYRCAATRSSTDRSGHRPGARLPTSARRATARRLSDITEQYSNNPIEADRSRLYPDYDPCAVTNGCAPPE
jgi:hypothetical protein